MKDLNRISELWFLAFGWAALALAIWLLFG